ncbi:MAG: hypothetical protein HYV63_14290 [Candidatus Schekmanbacteria bacterium]|nr:hypothetical protein [Candidatus Schekmanbacteria bacterium]
MAKQRFHTPGIDAHVMGKRVEAWLKSQFFETEVASEADRVLIQARKSGFPRSFVAANRALNVLIEGSEGDVSVQVTTGHWLENLATVGIVAYLTGPIGLAATTILAGLTLLGERELWDYIREQAARGA